MSDKKKGTIKWFNQKKNFGFIVADDGSGEIFFHGSEVEKAKLRPDRLKEGARLAFDLEKDRQGRSKAVNLQAA